MKLVVLYGLITSVFLSFGSCRNTDEEFVPDDVLPPVPEGYVRMQITVPGLVPVSTYALSSVDETNVSTVGVLVFKDGPNANDDTYLCYAAVTEPSKITGTGSTKTFDVDLRAAGNITDAYVMVVANASVDTTGFAASRPTKETVMASMTFASSGKWHVAKTNDTDFTPLPMWGMTASPVSLAGASSIPSISLLRSVARIDVGIKFPENPVDGTETAAGLGSTFTLEEVYLYNSLNKGSVAPYSGYYSGTTVTEPSIPTSPAPGINNLPVPSYLSSNGTADGFSADKFSCTGAIYMAEHAAGSDATLSTNPYLVVGGKYNGSGTVTYYRLDFVSGSYPSQTFLPVLRNHRYRFNITGVSGPGYTSADLASTGLASTKPVNLTYDLSATDESLTSYVYDGQYALGVSQDNYTLDNTARTGITLQVSTTYEKGYTAVSSNTSWLVITGGASTSDANSPGSPTTLTFRVDANTGGQREGTITITSGRLTKVITVTQKSTADAFTVTAQSSIGSPFAANTTSSTAIRVTSTYSNWCVRVDSDPDAIISNFTPARGDVVTSQVISLTLKPNLDWSKPTAEATLTFFSPTNEFLEQSRKVYLQAGTFTAPPANPTTHGDWAGSNIYWDSSKGYLTFDDTPASNPAANAPGTAAEAKQGVYFQWGSLVGLDPSSAASATGWVAACKVYVPNTASSTGWSQQTAGTTVAPGAAATSANYFTNWTTKIPYVNTAATANRSQAYLSTTAHDPAAWKGDICRYLTETGKAPGLKTGTKWRMPIADEFGAAGDYATVGNWSSSITTNTSIAGTYGQWPVTYSSIYPGVRKNTPGGTGAYRPFFPGNGYRSSANGALTQVGYGAYPWSSSPGGDTSAYGPDIAA
ncbi:MAG: hypothetical protein LBR26_12950 [Prevotella sp.]|jgi:hypothetical protein|nr:hypothetical protein [Prevotella sp.]